MGRLTQQLEQAMRGSVATPVIIKTKREFLPELRNHLLLDFKLTGRSIPRFSMFATVLPSEVIDEVKQFQFVETIYLDREVRIPEIRGAAITFDPIKRLMVRLAEVRADRAITFRKPEWVPTSESRKLLEADIAGAEGYEGQGVKIGVVDTDSSPRYQAHPQLSGRVTGHTVTEEVSDKNGHGGHVATTAFGGSYSPRLLGLKLLGIAPKATGIGIKVLRGAVGMGNTSDVIKGVEYAAQWGANVINLSLGGEPTKDPLEDPMFPVFQEIKDNIIACVAIGNEGPDASTTSAPGSLPNVLAVGAIDIHGSIANFSSRGPTPDGRVKPDVVAPGVNIFSGITLDTYLDHMGDYLGNAVSPLSGTCLVGDTLVGDLPIREIEVGERVPSVLGTDIVLAHLNQGINRTLRVILEDDREIEATPEHKFLVYNNRGFIWIPLIALKRGDKLVEVREGTYPLEQRKEAWTKPQPFQSTEREVEEPRIQKTQERSRVPIYWEWREEPILWKDSHRRNAQENVGKDEGTTHSGEIYKRQHQNRYVKTPRFFARLNSLLLRKGIHSYTLTPRLAGSRFSACEGWTNNSSRVWGSSLNDFTQIQGFEHYLPKPHLDKPQSIEVKAIHRGGKQRVYDITTLSHTFLANGVIVHNSMATPHVAGLMALAIQLFKKELPEVKLTTDLVFQICQKYGQVKDNMYGWGRIRWSWFKQYIEEHT